MKIIVSDFDETFYTDQYEENINRIKQFVNKGNLFIIATGRNIELLKDDIEWHNIPFSYLICNDGATVYDKNYNLLENIYIEPSIVKNIFDYFDKHKNFEEVWIDHHGEHTVDTNVSANKIIVRYENTKEALKELENIIKKYPNITGYLSTQWINIVDVKVNKGKAIEKLALKNNWDKDDIYTIGDSTNDISMITMFRGYTVENAIDELKKISIKTIKNFEELIDLLENSNI